MKNSLPIKNVNLVLISLLSMPAFAQESRPKQTRPNILFIAVDDMKPVLGCYGDQFAKTPNIDRLAKRATVFMSNYCQQAVSGPTRASLMTGKRPDYTQVWDLQTRMRDINPSILAMPQYFAQQGYETAGIGKIYDSRCVDNAADKPSWSIPFYNVPYPFMWYYQNQQTLKEGQKYYQEALAKGMNDKDARAYAYKFIFLSTECIDVPDDVYHDGKVANRSREILTGLAKDKKPFFFATGFNLPHLPFCCPKKYWDLYKREEVPLAKFQEHAKNSPELAYTNSGELRTYTDIPPLASFTDLKVNRIGLPVEKQRELIHGYYACTSYIDAQVGKLLKTLDSLGLSDNTIIVLWGDHGWHLGDHDLWNKHTNFENAARAPLLISAPGIPAGKATSISEFVDIFPTLCDLSGLQIPEKLDGKSLVPMMKDHNATVKDYAVSQYPHQGKMGYSIRTKSYRLTWWMKNGFVSTKPFSKDLIVAKELYDYDKDPLETINVVDEKAYTTINKDLESKMISYFNNQKTNL